ncbi:MAG TPA: S8 family peptidase, partial [Chitinophagaceae bacterium]|nr:S8 family peptidase [Chitinophagaceae bacterium]
DYSIPGANGKNIVVGVKEQQPEERDLDLYQRLLISPISAPDKSNHATVISSIIGGAGNSFYDGRGIAYGCTFFPSSFGNLFADDTSILNVNKVTVQNHSYGTIIQQFYGAEAVSYDALAWAIKNYIPVFSAGNQGSSSATDGKYANIPGYANLTGNFKMAKNVMTIGAMDNKGNIAVESSAGPLYDGRLAPQLIALGPNGTSDAAAVASGTIAVMQQVYADSNNQALPAASLIKAVLYNSAEDIYKTGIDYKTGYGLLDSYASIKAIQQKQYDGSTISQNQVWTKTIAIPVNAAQLKVTLVWTDTTAIVNNNKAIINDPDLELIELNTGTIYKPWVLNAAAHVDSLAKLPTRRRDSLNTAEQVSIHLPATGNYQLKVTGTNIPSAALSFHVAWHIDTLNTFHFTSPQHTSDVIREEDANLFIRWKTFVADTNQTGNLYISYNRGVDWQLLQSSYKLYTNQYSWAIKDTNSTALLKMETGFGDFLSKEFIISKVIRPKVDFICTDSFSLSWNKYIYADSYKIFALTDSPYLKHILTVTDTFHVMKRTLSPWLVYAVEPVLNNAIPASRSIALDIQLQGVTCFYKTFYYNLLDQNQLDLVLELSAPAYIDSVYFERISPNGQLLQIYGAVKVNDANFIYHQLANDVPVGNTHWRARIKLKSGGILYTDPFTVLTSGQRYIVFYPNPVSRNSMLTYVLQQGIPNNSRLQLFDMSGRLLKEYIEMPGSINVSAIAAGMIIYKLISADGKVLEKGKIVVQ